jgi:hypothetical protein
MPALRESDLSAEEKNALQAFHDLGGMKMKLVFKAQPMFKTLTDASFIAGYRAAKKEEGLRS